ncbi:transcriptional regulator with XRE-family HTH domain [Mycolicibacterium iranicum]|uniref:Transcriptional regulator with XRE-family HTH domain n=1 Tax=Mycolicibacterium iranicum TaxID=912594 RepID=A0A839Q234_MYCIR|nr:FHA domain-containing protein [Mycolicibacterium iranicum]MBB2988984.1 transcriptional regulator with XRE-family HTH domain [Mycolicibacterium iranicum]
MTSTEIEGEQPDGTLPLTVRVGSATHTFEPSDTPVVVGRDDPDNDKHVQIPLSDSRISRRHLVVTVRDGDWVGTPEGRNGVFVDGQRKDDPFVIAPEGMTVVLGHPFSGIPIYFSTLDPDIVYVGAQVAKRRTELDLSQRTLAANKVINAGALISFEKGRSWPRDKTRERLEAALGWPPGTLAKMRREHAATTSATAAAAQSAEGERTEVLGAGGGTTTVEAKYMAETIALALANIRAQIDSLPAPADPAFPPRAAALLGDLARLEALAYNASRGALGAETVFVQLSAVRRAYRELMMRAATSPQATLGQRLFAARHRAELSVEEAATMVGLQAADVKAAETGEPVSEPALSALHRLLSALQ